MFMTQDDKMADSFTPGHNYTVEARSYCPKRAGFFQDGSCRQTKLALQLRSTERHTSSHSHSSRARGRSGRSSRCRLVSSQTQSCGVAP